MVKDDDLTFEGVTEGWQDSIIPVDTDRLNVGGCIDKGKGDAWLYEGIAHRRKFQASGHWDK